MVGATELFYSDLPVVEFSEEFVDVVVDLADAGLPEGAVLDDLDVGDDLTGDLFAPFLALLHVEDLADSDEAFRALVLLFVDEVAFHCPPAVEHCLGFLAVAGHFFKREKMGKGIIIMNVRFV